jgi:Tol biopolymer transport system component
MAAESGAEQYQKAVTQERAGKLDDAIKLYEKVARDFASDHPLAAKALMAAAHCTETLGRDSASKLYEQVTRDFSDQRELAQAARTKLAALRQPAPPTMTVRRIEGVGQDLTLVVSGLINTDGHHAISHNEAAGTVIVTDLATANKRVIFTAKPGDQVLVAVPSRDFALVLLAIRKPDGMLTLAVTKSDGSDYREIARVQWRIVSVFVVSWSWDDRYIIYGGPQRDVPARVFKVAVADGQSQELLRRDEPRGAFATGGWSFSPDGRFVAYHEGLSGAKVFILPAQGGEPRLISENARVLDWTRDGRYLAVASTRSGSEALYLLPMKDGSPAGDPVFVRYGSFWAGRTTPEGALVYESIPRGGFPVVSVTTLDSNNRLGMWKPLGLSTGRMTNPIPSWSPDGSQIAYIATNEDAGQSGWIVRIHNVVTGEEREVLRRTGGGPLYCFWAAQHPTLFCSQQSARATDVFSVSVDSGQASSLTTFPEGRSLRGRSRDDRQLYMSGPAGLVKWDVGLRQETVTVVRGQLTEGGVISPDERWVISSGDFAIRALSGGDWRRLAALRAPTGLVAFTPDGDWILFHNSDSSGNHLFRIPTAGGTPEPVGDSPCKSPIGSLHISPDGHKIVAVCFNADSTRELWKLENFEPAAR